MKTYDLDNSIVYDFDCEISKEEYDYANIHEGDVIDEWCAAVVMGDIGVEYNFSVDWTTEELLNFSAIYKMATDSSGYMLTDGSKFIHYEIDFNDEDWEGKLEKAMVDALLKFFDM